ncbi:MAG: DUF3833 domain-containing protein [Alphaproteobacteria bacterium]|nr:MAG: DUF3833 domain-containing protein [Alphaproteobacteria bacterium]
MLLLSALALAPPPLAAGTPVQSALKFFEGETRSDGTLKIMWGKQRRSRSVGQGTIRPDGSLSLVQKVDDEGKPPHERRWLIRPVAPGRYSGTMSQAQGPVTIDEVSGRYRLQLKTTSGLSVEQWLTPLPGGKSAKSHITVRKLGMVVATGEGMVVKTP